MVGLADIPFVGKVVDRISDAVVDAFVLRLRYLFCYKKLVNILDSEIENVKIQQDRVSKKSAEERNNGKIIEDRVLTWQKDVVEFQKSAEEFSEKYKNRASWTCLKCLPIPEPVSRYGLGKEAARNAERAIKLTNSGKVIEMHHSSFAHLPPIENLPRDDGAFQDFPSRKDVYGKLWEELITEGSSLILGIYGMPGVGKTRMMEQIWKEAVEKKIFNKVARADVGGETLDVIKLQNQIAGDLNCHLESQDDVKSRASQLKNSLMNGGKILVILDDVWREIPLDDIIGTSFGESSSSKGSKILLTSRYEDACKDNKCERPVQITALEHEEAWDLFQDTADTRSNNSLQDDTLAKQVCAKCAGLPLLIRAVGKTLRRKSYYVWKDALQKLEKGNFKNIAGIDSQVYLCIRWSIDRLQDDAKLCLFLCSLFPEDAYIEITKLIQLSIGSQLVPDGECTIPAMVEVLTKSSLLLESDEDHITKLHDIIRDVARSVAFEDPKYAFLHVRRVSQLGDNVGCSTSKLLRLDVEGDDVHFPDDLVCTDLTTLWLHCNNHQQKFSGGFFSMFVNLGFLMLQKVDFHTVQFSLQPLGKLKMLILDECHIRKTDDSLFPKNLKTLCIWKCDLPSPLHLPILIYLQKLDIQHKWSREVLMVPNVIPSLSSLEELHIPEGYRFSDDAKDITPILDEISKLTRLTSLKIFLSDFKPGQDTTIFFKLSKYDIKVGGGKPIDREALPKSTKMIDLTEVEVKRDGGLQSLMERAEEVKLFYTSVDVSSICNSNREAFADLRDLTIYSCDSMECVARISQDKIQHSWQPQTSFSKLTNLEIKYCSKMKYLFSKYVVKCLVQLQRLRVDDCRAMEVIVMNEGTSDGEIIEFSKLKSLELSGLQSLRSFYREKKEMDWGSTDNSVMSCAQFEPLFDGMVAFPSLEELSIGCFGGSDIWGKHINDDNSFCKLKRLEVGDSSKFKMLEVKGCSELERVIPHAMLHRLRNLEYLYIRNCDNLKNAFSPCIARGLIHLKEIIIDSCRLMRELIGGGKQEESTDDDDGGIIMFPELTVLKLEDLPGLKNAFSPCIARGLIHLQEIIIKNCRLMMMIGGGKQEEITDDDGGIIVFPELTVLELVGLSNLMGLWCYWDGESNTCNYKVHFPSLVHIKLDSCGGINLEALELGRDDSTCPLKDLNINTKNQMQLPCKWKNKLYNLETLSLTNCWWHDLKSLHLPRLKKLYVRNPGRSALFTVLEFRSLSQLERLHISGCALLEEIVEDGKGDETSDTNDKIIVLSQLSHLSLEDLPNLRSFSCSVSYAFNMPKLNRLHLFCCPQLETFTYFKTSTGFVTVMTEEKRENITDLNVFIIQKRERGSKLVEVLE